MTSDNDKSSRLRRKAEKILQQNGIQNPDLYKRDLESLVEELNIHQIELEQQNEELKQTQLQLELSRDRFSDLFNNAPIGYLIIRKDYRILDVNITAATLLAMQKQDIKEKFITSYIHPDSQDAFYFHLKEALRSDQPQSCELQLKKTNGNVIHVSFESTRIKDITNPEDASSIRAGLIDITDRKEKEHIRSLLSTTLDSSDDAIIGLTRDLTISSWNKGAEKLYGFSREEVIGKYPGFLITEERKGELENYLHKIFNGEAIRHFETTRITRSGKKVNISLSVSPVYDDQKRIVGAVTISRNITEKKKHERLISQSEKKYRTIFENSANGFLLIKDKILDCNKQAARLFGYSEEELTGKDPVVDLSPNKQPDGTNSAQKGNRLIQSALNGEVERFYWKHKNRNGKPFDTEITLNAIDTEEGRHIMAIIHDISDQIEHQRQLKEKNEEIETQNEEYMTLNEELNETNSKLKQTIEELKTSKENLQEANDIINKSSAVAFLWKNAENWPVEFVSENVEQLFGYTGSDFTSGKIPFAEVIYPRDKQRVIDEVIGCSKDPGKNAFTQEYRIIDKQGNIKWVDDRTWIQRDQQGKAIYFKGILLNITERKQAEEGIKKSEQKFKTLFNSASDAIYIHDLKGNMLEVNEAAEKFLKYSKDELLNMKPSDIDTAKHANLFQERLKKIQNSQYAFFETEHVTKNGKVIPLELNARIIDYEGQEAILAISRDITERKKTEQEMAIKNRISNTFINSDSENFYNDILTIFREIFNSQFGFFGYINEEGDLVSPSLTKGIWDKCQIPDKTIVFARESWGGLWGESLKEKNTLYRNGNLHLPKGHIQLTSAMAAAILEDDRLLGQVALANKPGGYTEDDKKLINILCEYVAPLLHSKIQEEQYKKSLLEAKEKAEESDRLKSAFLANMSHEIRTPMNGVLGFTQLMINNTSPTEHQKNYLDIIYARGKHLLQIINDIIDISKIEANQLKIGKKLFCLNDLMLELYNIFAAEIENESTKDIRFNLETGCAREESFIYADESRLRQILINLLNNAFKFTTEGSIEFGYKLKDFQTLHFFVKDTGIGIPEEKHHEIFQRFIQVEENSKSRTYEGTGLGLSISKNLVRLMNGEIVVHSEENKGSTFHFTLPFEKGKSQTVSENKDSSNLQKYDWNNHTILVIEDDPVSLKYLREILDDTGAEIIQAQNGSDGYALYEQNTGVSIILMDLKLPDKSGIQVTKDIRLKDAGVPIIAQTAYAMNEDKKKVLEAGCTDYVSKPVDPRTLLSIMNKHLNNRGAT